MGARYGKGMSRGQSQPRTQSGRTLIGCKNKGKFDNVVVIDVDRCKSRNVVIIDPPECSGQRDKCFATLKKNSEWPSSGIISIDDEEGNANDDPTNGDEGGDLVSDATSSKKLHPTLSLSHRSSEESDGVDCEIFDEETNFRSKVSKFMWMCPGNLRLSRNRFSLYTESESSSSESDSSDCELMEDSSGKIREQWEKAAFKKNVSNRRFGLDDQVSASGSTSDPINISQETSQENIDKEKSVEFVNCVTVEQCASAPIHSNSSDAGNGKDNLSTCNTTFKPGRKGPVADLDQLADGISYETAGSEDKDEQVSEESMCKSQLWDDENFDNKGASSWNNEKPMTGEHSSHDTQLPDGTYVHHSRSDFQDKKEAVTTRIPDGMGVCIGRASSQNEEDSVRGEPSCCDTKSQHEMQANHDTASFREKVKSYLDEACLNNRPQGETRASNRRAVFEDKEELVHMVPPLCKTQVHHHAQVDPGVANFHDEGKTISEESSLENGQPWDVTKLSNGATCLHMNEKVALQEPSLYNSQRQDESETPVMSVMLDARNTDGVAYQKRNTDSTPVAQNSLIGDREKHKESDEYKRALEEEWASRHQELQIQAEEAQRMRKRKKAENMRLLDMEKRQRQRLEEVRETQKKDEETINLKEKLRAEIREELDNLELKYRDMASLLRGLGIHVGGGLYPMPREINAAYKQALLKFHPDRASRSDIRQQVQAEEIFKLISRLKEKLLPAV